jgi:hypothetical protein
MTTVVPETVITQLRWRYATKKFDPSRKIAAETWDALEQSLVLTPSSYGLQPWKFFVVLGRVDSFHWAGIDRQDRCTGHELPERDVDLPGSPLVNVERWIGQAPDHHLLIAREGFDGLAADLRGASDMAIDVFLGQVRFDRQDDHVRTILRLLLTPRVGRKLRLHGRVGDDEELGIAPQGYRTVVACAAGYRSPDDKYAATPKVRFKTEDVVQRI